MIGSDEWPDIQAELDELDESDRKSDNPAGYIIERLKAQLQLFQKEIADDAEVGIVSAGTSGTFHLRHMSVSDPDMLIFDGIDQSGRKMQLFQHYGQLSVMFVEVQKIEERPYRIGFT